MKNNFYDIHTHILPSLDEGASDIEGTLKMIEIAKKDGIAGIVATPHIMKGVYDNTKSLILDTMKDIQRRINGIMLYLGAEFRMSHEIVQRIKDGSIPLINDKRYILLEFSPYSIPPLRILQHIFRELKNLNITPIIGHPERNMFFLNNAESIKDFIHTGCIFQATAMSITGEFGDKIKKAVMKMIKDGYISAIASDAHDPLRRPPILSRAYEVIKKSFGKDRADELFIYNPKKIIDGFSI